MTMFPIVILAGGLATRLRPLTTTIPKALIDIKGEPFIAHQLRLLKKQGLTEIILCLGYLGNMVQDYLGDGSAFGMKISYSFDGDQLLGTAGAIKKALSLISTEAFFVIYGDSYLPCDMNAVQKYFIFSDKQALMTVFHNNGQWDKSNVEFTAGTILNYDKINITSNMEYIDYGLGMFTQQAFANVPDNKVYDLATLYQELLAQKELVAFEVKQRFYEIGSHSGIKELSDYLGKTGAN